MNQQNQQAHQEQTGGVDGGLTFFNGLIGDGELLDQFQRDAARTAPEGHDEYKQLRHGLIGIFTEVAELADAEKKLVFYGKECSRLDIALELGDLCWYIALAASSVGLKLSECERAFMGIGIAGEGCTFVTDAPGSGLLGSERSNVVLSDLVMGSYGLYMRAQTDTGGVIKEDREVLPAVLGKLMQHINIAAQLHGLTMKDILIENIAKLRLRYPDKFDAERAINKDAAAEAQQLGNALAPKADAPLALPMPIIVESGAAGGGGEFAGGGASGSFDDSPNQGFGSDPSPSHGDDSCASSSPDSCSCSGE